MADPAICTASVSPNNCAHRTVTVAGLVLTMGEADLIPLSDEERDSFFRLAIRYGGVALADLLNRVVHGVEATNVKAYNLVAPGAVVSKTNVGTAWTNVLPGANGQRVLVDLTGCTEFLLVLTANLVGTGPFGFRVVRDADDAALYENEAIAQTGERELNTGWLPLPLAAGAQEIVRFQCKSASAIDDPVIRRCTLYLR